MSLAKAKLGQDSDHYKNVSIAALYNTSTLTKATFKKMLRLVSCIR